MMNGEATEKLTAIQVVTRIISVLVGAAGFGACVYSLSLQVQEVGSIVASVCWFSGLGAVVTAIAGYVVTCSPQRKNYVPVAVVAILALGVCLFWLEHRYLWTQAVILLTLAALAVQAVVLVLYHVHLRHEDPQAL